MYSQHSINKCLLAVEPYEFTAKQIGELRDKYCGRNYERNRYLPDYCIKDNGKIGWSENYLQFVGFLDDNPDEKYILFDIYTSDKLLELELNEFGFEGDNSLFSEIVNWEEIVTSIIKDKFKIHKFDSYKRSFLSAQYIVVEISYFKGYEDWDMNVDILGYLDNNFMLHGTKQIETTNS